MEVRIFFGYFIKNFYKVEDVVEIRVLNKERIYLFYVDFFFYC